MGAFTKTFGKTFPQNGKRLNPSPPEEIPDGAIITINGELITTIDENYILTVNGFVPNNALQTLSGEYIKTLNNEFITI